MFEVASPFAYESALLKTAIVVPASFVTDFASVPRATKAYLDGDAPQILYPSVIHDWLYRMGGSLPDGLCYTRQEADAVLREAMLACGARWTQAAVVYAAVRVGGVFHWGDDA